MKKHAARISLHRETLRLLAHPDLLRAAGQTIADSNCGPACSATRACNPSCGNSCTCPGV